MKITATNEMVKIENHGPIHLPDGANMPRGYILEGRFAHIGQLADFIDMVLSTKEKYYLPTKCRITGCMRVSKLGGYFEKLPSYAGYFATGYFLHPACQLFLDEYRKHTISELDLCGGRDKLNDGRYAWEVFDDFVEKIRKRAKEIKLKSKIRDWDSRYRKNRESLDDQLAVLLDRHESLMVIRLDVHHGKFWLNPAQLEEFLTNEQMRRASEEAAYFAGADLVPEHGPRLLVDLPEVKGDLTRFLASRKGKQSLFKHFVGYAWRIECSDPGGFHVHMVLYFNGSKVQQHKWLAQRIGEYWRDKITKGQGRFHNCNLDWDESSPKCGVGMVRRKDFKKIAVDLILALKRCALAGAGQCPKFAAFLEHAGSLQFIATNLGQVAEKFEHRGRLNHLKSVGNHRQGRLGVRAIQHLLLWEGVDCTESSGVGAVASDVADFGFFDAPVHAGAACPDFDRLIGGQLISQAMPGGCVDIGHGLHEVHGELQKNAGIKRPGRGRACHARGKGQEGKSAQVSRDRQCRMRCAENGEEKACRNRTALRHRPWGSARLRRREMPGLTAGHLADAETPVRVFERPRMNSPAALVSRPD
ncbi:hypothetical protein J2X09_003400 [Hydrogenophaga laconesensis]|uniref:Inovirus Gp2 family protein n=1 Tax=Hydrogenophaga laconesensis TaxID=1805971 RepID=A0ABU1VDU3_9BURK|nr:hypothetical protein [Hydrogenophaga laconesensis]